MYMKSIPVGAGRGVFFEGLVILLENVGVVILMEVLVEVLVMVLLLVEEDMVDDDPFVIVALVVMAAFALSISSTKTNTTFSTFTST